MEWIRHNATGWTLVLVMGILYGRSSHIGRRVAYATVIMSVLLMLPSMLIFEPVSPSIIPLVVYLCLAFLLALVFRPFTNACYRRYLKGRST